MWFKLVEISGAKSVRRTVPTILSEGFQMEGDVVCAGEVFMGGTLTGNLTAGKVTIPDGGSINGSIEAETVIVNGTLSGRLVAVDVVLGRTARVTADIVYCSIRIEPGAVLEGYSRRVERDAIPNDNAEQLLPSLRSLRNAAGRSDLPEPAEAS